jgi:small subunit ribosomal protein S17
MSNEANRKTRRTVVGVVTSDKGDKSITVQVDRVVQHPRFKKYIRRQSKYHAHDENNDAHVGDRVAITECRPLSKNKSFRLAKVLERSRLREAGTGDDKKAEG